MTITTDPTKPTTETEVKPAVPLVETLVEQTAEKTAERKAEVNFMDSVLAQVQGKNLPAKVEEKPAAKVEEKPEAKVETAPKVEEPEVKPVKKPRGVKTKSTEELAADVGAAAGAKAAETILREIRPAPAAPVEKPEEKPEELSPTYKRDADAYRELAKIDPAKYGKIVPQLNQYDREFAAYKRNWEKENAGQKFNIEDTDHDTFVDAHAPAIDPEDLQQARLNVQTSRAIAPLQEKLDKLEGDRSRQTFEQQVQPKIARATASALSSAIAAIDPTLKGDPNDPEFLKKIDAENPLLSGAVEAAATEWFPVARAVAQLYSPGGGQTYDAKNPTHQRVDRLVTRLEVEASKLPASDTTDEHGRSFATVAQFARMAPAQRESHWTIGEQHVQQVVQTLIADRAKTIHDLEIKRIEGMGYTRPSKVAPKAEPSKEEEKVEKGPKVNGSPAVTTGAPVVGGGKPTNAQAPTFMDRFMDNAFGRKPVT